MLRNFALTCAAVTLRLWLPASILAGVPLAYAYPAIAWISWVPNLLFVELVFNRVHGLLFLKNVSGKLEHNSPGKRWIAVR